MRESGAMNRPERRDLLFLIPFLLAVILSGILLGSDARPFWAFYACALLLGAACMPVCGRLFEGFDDKGWFFSKILSLLLCGFLVWFLVSCRIMPFTAGTCYLVTAVLMVLFLVFGFRKDIRAVLPAKHFRLVLWEEILFLAVFLMWTYLAGLNPAASGTEKYMDYGFMEAMMRSTVLPARDLWYSQGHINYYYGGQYFAVFLTKLAHGTVEITYNLFRSFVAAFAFLLPFSLVYQMLTDQRRGSEGKKIVPAAAAAGLTGGAALSIAGNMHYVVYALVLPLVNKLKGSGETSTYWYPDSTRYIGYDPDVPDKTIHEFPSYSFVLGDLHAHVVNIIFVLLLVGILYALLVRLRERKNDETGVRFVRRELSSPHILLSSFMLGVFRWTNYWDFVIYFVVTGGTILFANIVRFPKDAKKIVAATVLHVVEMAVVSTLVSLPFTLQFESMVQGVALARNHSLPHQLLVLWGLPTALTVLLILLIILDGRSAKKGKGLFDGMRNTTSSDLFVVITGLCAMGLVLMPELVYVRDIYENGYARANTMFKLTYQAFILFAITMGYGIFRMMVQKERRFFRVASCVVLIPLILTVGYFGNSVRSWYGDIADTARYQGLNALAYLDNALPDDAPAIRWLKDNIQGSPVVLEANGDSYSTFGRVSSSTGLPTVLGWYVHEWLWRNDTNDLKQKDNDIETIYTSQDETRVRELLEDYDVSYVFVGSKEKEKYVPLLNRELLHRLGEVVFEDPESGTFIVKV